MNDAVKTPPSLEATLDALESLLDNRRQHAANSAPPVQALARRRRLYTAGRDAITAAAIINGGAVALIMSFIVIIMERPHHGALVSRISEPLLIFAVGVFAAASAMASRYVSQLLHARGSEGTGRLFTTITWALVLASLAAFAWGAYGTYESIRVASAVD